MSQRIVEVRNAVKQRSNGLCEICGTQLVTSVCNRRSMHHRFKKEYGGIDSLANLIDVCISCHRWIHEDEYASFVDWGYISDYPETTPCFLGQKWVLLDENYLEVTTKDANHILDSMVVLAEYRKEQAKQALEHQREKMRTLMVKTGRTKRRERYYSAIIMSTLSK